MNTISRAIRDYESGITALRERIALRKDEAEQMDPKSAQRFRLNHRIHDMECMCSVMEQSLHQEREYAGLNDR